MEGPEKAWCASGNCQSDQVFQSGNEARICLNGTTLDEIHVENGLRQGCCMAPVLFNLYTCLDGWIG